MMVDMDPAATYAVVVGLERYDGGWSLDGAARDAIRVATWLRVAAVPAEQIYLVVDPLPANQAYVTAETDELGLQIGVGARDGIIDIFTKQLTMIEPANGKHLVVFWSGHGVQDAQLGRVLFTADAHAMDKRTVQVDALLKFLRDKEIRGFHDQVVIIDACANFFEEMKSRANLTHATFPTSRSRYDVRQFVLYAAGQGQTAGHNQAAKYGEFTNSVLAVLHPAQGAAQWPPDMPEVSASVAAHFEQLREAGHSRMTPVYLSRNASWTGNVLEDEYGGIPVSGDSLQAAIEARITASQVRRLACAFADSEFEVDADTVTDALRRGAMEQLIDDLATHAGGDDQRFAVAKIRHQWRLQQRVAEPLRQFQGFPQRQLRGYYDMVPDRQLAPQLTELDEVLEYLAEFSEADDSAALFRFVARLELLTGTQLRENWFGIAPSKLKALRERERSRMAAANGCHLVLDLRLCRATDSGWPTKVTSHLRTADGQWSKECVDCEASKDGARDAVNQLITLAHECLAPDSVLTLGFLVSRARFDDVPESWIYGDKLSSELSLGEEYPVVLHSGDRIGVPRARERWRVSAQRIANRLEFSTPEILWIQAPLNTKEIFTAVLNSDAACVVFADVPGPLRGGLPGDPLIAAINPGAPYLIWFDEAPVDWAAARALITTLVQKGEFDKVPMRILRIRQEGTAGPPSSGIRVLWDDQELLPEFGQLTGIDVRTA